MITLIVKDLFKKKSRVIQNTFYPINKVFLNMIGSKPWFGCYLHLIPLLKALPETKTKTISTNKVNAPLTKTKKKRIFLLFKNFVFFVQL